MPALVDKLVAFLTEITALDDRINRDLLLQRLPPNLRQTLQRGTTTRADLEHIVIQTLDLGILSESNKPAIVVLLEAVRPYLQGTARESRLDSLLLEPHLLSHQCELQGSVIQQVLRTKAASHDIAHDPAVHTYLQALEAAAGALQQSRSFIDSRGIPLHGVLVSPAGHIDSSLANFRIRMEARKMSREDLREKYGGNVVTYDDFLNLPSKHKREVTDVVHHLVSIDRGWAIQLLGAPGSGKSFVVREACINVARSYATRPLVPFLVELRDAPSNGFSNNDEVLTFITNSSSSHIGDYQRLTRAQVANIFADGNAFVVFDAIDELADPVNCLRSLSLFIRDQPYVTNRYVFSCRTFDQVPGLVAEELLLLPLSRASLQEYFDRALYGHDLLPKIRDNLRHAQLQRDLATPLAASSYARFVKDKNRLPLNTHETLTETLRQRFFASAVRKQLLDRGATQDQFDALYMTVACGLQQLACEMQNRLTALEADARIAVQQCTAAAPSLTIDPLEWAQAVGIIYKLNDNRVAFSLNRYKELYLADRWIAYYQANDRWPDDVKDRIGRVIWTEAITLLAGQMVGQMKLAHMIESFCTDRFANLEELDLIERCRLIEAIILLGRITSSPAFQDSTNDALYLASLRQIHLAAFNDALMYNERSRLIKSLASHSTREAADVLLAVYDDANTIHTVAFVREMLVETTLLSLAELVVAGVLDDSRCEEYCERLDRSTLKAGARAKLGETRAGQLVIQKFNRKIRRQCVIAALWMGGVAAAVALIVFVFFQGIWATGGLFAVVCLAAWGGSRALRSHSLDDVGVASRSRAGCESSIDSAAMVARKRRGHGVPYSEDRYWLQGGERGSIMTRSPSEMEWRSICNVVSGLSGFAWVIVMVIGLYYGMEAFRRLMEVLLWVCVSLIGLLYCGLILAAVGVGIWNARSIGREIGRSIRLQVRLRRERKLAEKQWRDRLRRVRDEADRLRTDNRDVVYIVNHLMESVDGSAVGLGNLQARLEAIRSHIIADKELIGKLGTFARSATGTEVRKLLEECVEDVSRVYVIAQETNIYRKV